MGGQTISPSDSVKSVFMYNPQGNRNVGRLKLRCEVVRSVMGRVKIRHLKECLIDASDSEVLYMECHAVCSRHVDYGEKE